MVLYRKRCKSTCSRSTNEVCIVRSWYLADEKFKESRSLSGGDGPDWHNWCLEKGVAWHSREHIFCSRRLPCVERVTSLNI